MTLVLQFHRLIIYNRNLGLFQNLWNYIPFHTPVLYQKQANTRSKINKKIELCPRRSLSSIISLTMGATCSTENLNNSDRFIPLSPVQLYHFGEVRRYYDQLTCREVIKPVYEFVVESDAEEHFMNHLKMNNNKCAYLVSIVKIEVQPGNFCDRGSRYHVYFQYLPLTLNVFLKQQPCALGEQQVRTLLRCLFDGIKSINQRQTFHGDIFPQFVYIDDKGSRRYKIFDSAYFDPLKHGRDGTIQVTTRRYAGYYRALEESSYSSPEILANLSERKSFPLYNHYVSDTFSIGLIALYAMTLIDPVTAYKNKNKQIDYYYIEMLLRIAAQNGYSECLLQCVAECVQLKNRPTVDEILSSYTEFRCENPHNSWLKLSLRKTGGEE